MRKTLCAFALTLMLCVATLAGEIPNGGGTPPPPPPPPPGGEMFGNQPTIVQTLEEYGYDETVTDSILSLIQNVFALY